MLASITLTGIPPAYGQPQDVIPDTHVSHALTAVEGPNEASGTAWQPAVTPMAGWHRAAAGWTFMLHGNAFVQYLRESGEIHRRGQQAGSINWFMGMAARPAGTGRLQIRVMTTLEPWTIAGCGYPNLLATGEVCNGDTLHDQQHPHDLFMELAVEYSRPLAGDVRGQIYAGLAGEPALGPPGFPHRMSAFANPIAPVTHHWLDASHISQGVLTMGVANRAWKLEGSVFNGREPDDVRTNLSVARFDSLSGRLSWAPTGRVVAQISTAHLRAVEAGVGGQLPTDVHRSTASTSYHRPLGSRGLWATTLAYGVNSQVSAIPGGLLPQTTHAAMLESTVTMAERHSWFGRIELVGKPAHDLHAHEYVTSVFTVGKLQAGYVRHVAPWKGLLPGVGASVSASVVPPRLAPRYGGRVAPGVGLYVSLRPAGGT